MGEKNRLRQSGKGIITFLMAPLLFGSAPASAQAKAQTQVAQDSFNGILLYYKDVKLRSDIHAELQNKKWKLFFSAKSSPYEQWVPVVKSANQNAKQSRADEICKGLLKKFSKEKILCDLNLKPQALGESSHTQTSVTDAGNDSSSSAHSKAEALGSAKNKNSCKLLEGVGGYSSVPNYAYGKLSANWANEYVGSDLSRELFGEIAQKQPKIKPADVAVLDTFEDDHGGKVSQVLERASHERSRKSVQGASEKIDFFPMVDEESFEDGQLYNSNFVRQLENMPSGVDVVNISMGKITETTFSVFSDYSKKHRSLFVVAAGNDAQMPPKAVYSEESFTEGILVGSIRPDSWMSDFSTPLSNLTVAAPSDNYISSKEAGDFSGTSGAAPLVSAALTQVKSILPELNADQAKLLIRATALPTPNMFFEPQTHGHGTLNSYGLLKIAHQVGECVQKQKSPNAAAASLDKCLQIEIKKTEELLKRRPARAEQVLLDAERAFGCRESSPVKTSEAASCDKKRDAFRSLRQAAFESPMFGPYWNALACVHRGLGFDANAGFYLNLGKLNPWPTKTKEEKQAFLRKSMREMLMPPAKNNLDYLGYSDGELKEMFSPPLAVNHLRLLDAVEQPIRRGNQRYVSILGSVLKDSPSHFRREIIGTFSVRAAEGNALALEQLSTPLKGATFEFQSELIHGIGFCAQLAKEPCVHELGKSLEVVDPKLHAKVVDFLIDAHKNSSIEARAYLDKVSTYTSDPKILEKIKAEVF